jgi:hypothetical protein
VEDFQYRMRLDCTVYSEHVEVVLGLAVESGRCSAVVGRGGVDGNDQCKL